MEKGISMDILKVKRKPVQYIGVVFFILWLSWRIIEDRSSPVYNLICIAIISLYLAWIILNPYLVALNGTEVIVVSFLRRHKIQISDIDYISPRKGFFSRSHIVLKNTSKRSFEYDPIMDHDHKGYIAFYEKLAEMGIEKR